MNKKILELYFKESKSVDREELSYSNGKSWLLKHGFKYLYNGFNGFEAWRGWIYVKGEMYSVLVRWRFSESKYLWAVEVCQSKENRALLINGKEISPKENDTLEYAMSTLTREIHWAELDRQLTTRKVSSKELDFPRRMLALHMYDDEPEHSDSCVSDLARKEA